MTAISVWRRILPASLLCTVAGGVRNDRAAARHDGLEQIAVAVVRDSANVRIVEYPSLAPKAPWFVDRSSSVLDPWNRLGDAVAIGQVPFRDFGGDGSAVELKDALFAAAIELPNGTFVVADKDRLLRVDSRGRLLSSSGRAGRGPGEFDDIRSLCILRGDTVAVIDKLGMLSVWNGLGSHIRTIAERDPLLWASCDGQGHLVSASRPRLARIDPRGLERRTQHWLARPSGERIRSLGQLPAPVMAGLLSWQPSLAWSGEELVVARGRRYELEWRNVDGRVRQIMRLTGKTDNISDAQWRNILFDAVPAGSSSSNRVRVLEMMGPKPNAAFPAHGSIIIDPKRRVWVADFADPSSVTVFSHKGALIGRVQLRNLPGSPRPALVDVGSDYIQVREQDADGFVHLRFYRMEVRQTTAA